MHTHVPTFYRSAAGNMHNIKNTEKNKFPDQHRDVASSVPTSTHVFSNMLLTFW